MYCVYLTFYKGNKLPPFYIGYSTVKNVNNGYHGTVSSREYQPIWRNELKTHPDLFKTTIIRTFDKRGDAMDLEERLQRALNAHAHPLHINKAIAGKQFNCDNRGIKRKPRGPRSPELNARVSLILKGKKKTPEHIEKIRQANLGKKRPPRSEETKRKISAANLGRKQSVEERENHSKALKGYKQTPEHIEKRRIAILKSNSKEWI